MTREPGYAFPEVGLDLLHLRPGLFATEEEALVGPGPYAGEKAISCTGPLAVPFPLRTRKSVRPLPS